MCFGLRCIYFIGNKAFWRCEEEKNAKDVLWVIVRKTYEDGEGKPLSGPDIKQKPQAYHTGDPQDVVIASIPPTVFLRHCCVISNTDRCMIGSQSSYRGIGGFAEIWEAVMIILLWIIAEYCNILQPENLNCLLFREDGLRKKTMNLAQTCLYPLQPFRALLGVRPSIDREMFPLKL